MATQPSGKNSNPDGASASLDTTQALRLAAVACLLIGCFLVLRPFISALMWSVVLCLSSWPLYARLEQALGGRRTLAALLMTLITVLVMLAPFVVIGVTLADDVRTMAGAAYRFLESKPAEPPDWIRELPFIGHRAEAVWREWAADSASLSPRLRQFVEPVTTWLLGASVQLAGGLVELGFSVFIGFFLFRDGAAAASRFTAATQQLAGDDARPLIELAAATMRGVVYGILGTALVQSILAGIGLAIAGVPGPAFLALLTFFLSVTPLGAPMIWIPAAVWLFAQGSVGWGVFMVIWGLVISSSDNVIKPMIISQGSPMPFIVILLGILGGALAFGFIGVFLGPTLLAVGLRLLEQWNVQRTGARPGRGHI